MPHVIGPIPSIEGAPSIEGVPYVGPEGQQPYTDPSGQIPGSIGSEGFQGSPDGQDPFGGALGDMNGAGNAQDLPSGLGAVAAAESPDIHMIGDYFGSGYFLGGTDGFATVPGAGGDRRFKATDNLSPVPQDRAFFNYHHFNNAVSDIVGVEQDVDRFTFGLERTFLDGAMSLEFRLPFAAGLNSAQVIENGATTAAEFGNITFTLKALLWERRSWLVTSGLATVIPTAEDATVDGFSTSTVLENNAVHLQPYLGLTYSNPCSRWFSTVYGAVDFDANGNALFTGPRDFPGSTSPGPLGFVADVRDQTLLFFDWQVGYWLYRDYGHVGWLNAVAPVLELHYSQTLDDAEQFGVYRNPFGQVDLLNITGGLVFDFRKAATVTVYGAAPLRKEEAMLDGRLVSPVFDAEFGVQAVYRY